MNLSVASRGLLGDTTARDYSRKLQLFNAFARPELREAIASLGLKPGMRVLDAGCGTGEALSWLSTEVEPGGVVVGMDLATAHIAATRAVSPANALVIQADLLTTPLAPASLDAIWSVNTFNHLQDPVAAAKAAATLLRPGGRIALGQSSLLPDMYFAWDSRLERLTNEAVRQYYRNRYKVSEHGLTAIRSLVGLLRAAGLHDVTVRTFMIERISPVSSEDEHYLVEAIFQNTWGTRLQPYLLKKDYEQLTRLCDPEHPDFALRRPTLDDVFFNLVGHQPQN